MRHYNAKVGVFKMACFKVTRSVYGILAIASERCGIHNWSIVKKIGKALREGIGRLAPSEVMVKVHGHTMVVPRDFGLIFLRPYEPATTALLKQLLEPGMTFVDVGAHVGYYSLLASAKVGLMGKVYSFEPEPHNYSMLIRNIALNDCKNVIVVQKAVADFTGEADLIIAPYSVSHSLYSNGVTPKVTNIRVGVVSLDDFFGQLGWPKVDLVKMDIEGAEISALRGMRGLCERNPTLSLIIEFKPRRIHSAGSSAEEFFSTLKGLGFNKVQDINTGKEIFLGGRDASLQLPSSSTNLFCQRGCRE